VHATSFQSALQESGHDPLRADRVNWVQINVGKLCNQACHHCHVDAGPQRTEIMTSGTAERIIELLRSSSNLELVDITGGAPELNPSFRMLVEAARDLDLRVMDRCNLTVLFQPGQEDLVDFLAKHRVAVVASLPCYLQSNVDKQRGNGVFDTSIAALHRLNEAGYGQEDSGLLLDLVYNPVGPFLPPDQEQLEQTYKQELWQRFRIGFNSLLTITNMPISRFRADLHRSGQLEEYQDLLLQSFNAGTVDGLMCRSMISIGWDGRLYDCDFNQMLDMGLAPPLEPLTIENLQSFSSFDGRTVRTGPHCFGCTAGSGSSCGGAIN